MNEAAFHEELRKILRSYSKKYQEIGGAVVEKIIGLINAGMGVSKAIDQALKETDFYAVNKSAVVDAVYLAACAGYGILPQLVAKPEKVKNRLLSESWTPDKVPLSSRLHSGAVKQRILDTVAASLRNVESVRELSRKLYDGYHSGKAVISAPKLPQYLENIAMRASMAGVDEEYREKLQGDIRVLLKETKKLKSPELKAAYKQLLDTCMSPELKQSAVKKAAWVAVQEKARYMSERIARTEASRAWFEGFIAENQENQDVWGYRWVLSSRHSKVPFDQCDVCANMDVGFGKGKYPKNKVPSIPRHPHCMCMLEVVFEWEADKTSKFNPDGARQYIGSLDEAKKAMLFGKDGLKEYEKGVDWQKLLRGWDKFREPESRLKNIFLNDLEKSAIQKYISSEAYVLNEKLRNGSLLSDDDKKLIAGIDAALEKLPKYQGTVYRSVSSMGIDNIDAFIKSHAVGTLYTSAAYTSTGTSVFDESMPIQYVIDCTNGIDLRWLNTLENEVLFPRDTWFKIIKVEGNIIYMEG